MPQSSRKPQFLHTTLIVSALSLFTLITVFYPSAPKSVKAWQAQPPVTFGTPVSYALGQNPQDFKAADFNGDGKLDLVSANTGANTVSLLLNRGDGTFNAKTDFPTGSFPLALTTGDFNNDGKRDVVTVGLTSNAVSLLLGNGNGGFSAKTDYPVGIAPTEVEAGDFNRDGKLDLAVGYTSTSQVPAGQKFVTVLLNTTTGTGGSVSFAPRHDVPVAGLAWFIVVADFNQDQNPDIATANSGAQSSFSLLLGNGNGAFEAARDTLLGNVVPGALDVADNNGDGKLDLLVSNLTGNPRIYPGNGDGAFGAPVEIVIPAAAADEASQPGAETRSAASPAAGKKVAKNFKCRRPGSTAALTLVESLLAPEQTQGSDLVASDGSNMFNYLPWQSTFSYGGPVTMIGNDLIENFDSYDLNGDGNCSLVSTDSTPGRVTVIPVRPGPSPSPCPTITISPAELTDKLVGTNILQYFYASGGTPPYSFDITSQNLPPSVSLSNIPGVDGAKLEGVFFTTGAFNFTVSVRDAKGCTGARNYTLKVKCPTISVLNASFGEGTVGLPSPTIRISVVNGVPPYTFSLSDGPQWLKLALSQSDIGETLINGTPTLAGTYTFTVIAKDSLGCTGTKNLTITINPGPVIDTPPQLPNGTTGSSYNQKVSVTGGTPPLNYTVNNSGNLVGDANHKSRFAAINGLPPGITLNNATGVLSGTPTTPGTYDFTITATDANNAKVSRAFTLTIACPTVALSPATLPAGRVGAAYAQTLTVTGGGVFSYAVTAGALPNGLTLNASGALSGMPTVAGTFNFTVRATSTNTCSGAQSYTLVIAALPNVASVSAATYRAEGFASDMIVAAFGTNLASATESASTLPLPTTLAGVSVRITDSANVERLAPLFYVSPQQINFLLPSGLAPGRSVARVVRNAELLAEGALPIGPVAPGLFTANANGQGVPAAFALRVAPDGTQTLLPVAQFDGQQNRFVPAALDFGGANHRLFLILFGTGWRHHGGLSRVTARIGGLEAPLFFAGAQGDLAGLDQLNLEVPRALIGRGVVDVVLVVEGQTANTVQVQIK